MPIPETELADLEVAITPNPMHREATWRAADDADNRALARERAERLAQSWHRALRRVIQAARPNWFAYDRAVKTYSARGVFVTGSGPAVSATFSIEPRERLLRMTAYPPVSRPIRQSDAGEVALAAAGATCAMSMRVKYDREEWRFTLEAVAVLAGPRAVTAATRVLLRDMQRVIAHEQIARFFRPNQANPGWQKKEATHG